MSREIVNSVLLLWLSLFCAVAVLYFKTAKSGDAQRRDWMVRMQTSAGCLMLSDAVAYLFRGFPGVAGFWIVRLSNFGVFFLTDLTLLFFHRYICASLLTKKERRKLKRVKAVSAACMIGIAMVVLSQFTGMYYTFDAANVYHRAALYPLSMVIPVVCMVLDSSLLMQFSERISRTMFLAVGSYFVLPLIAAAIQAVRYGWSLIDLSIGVSMVLMFLVAVKEQNEELLRLEASRAQIAEKLEIATVLNRCVEKLSVSGQDLGKASDELLSVINDYFDADRSYILELDAADGIVMNTHEFVRDGVTEEKDDLQEVPVEVIAPWMEAFEREEVYFMPDIEQEKGKEQYEILKMQNVHSLLAVPLKRDKQIIGFLGVDNPKKHYQDPTLLSSIQFFVTNSLEQKKIQKRLYGLSYMDMLTGLSNRNRYMEDLSRWEGMALDEIGGIYMDLNGLKRCNDRFGHEAGDALIRRAADALNEVFPGEGYRIGGDEFVVLLCPIGQEAFADKVHQLREALVRHGVDAAVGTVWKARVEDLAAFLREADDRMYREKERQKRSARPSV